MGITAGAFGDEQFHPKAKKKETGAYWYLSEVRAWTLEISELENWDWGIGPPSWSLNLAVPWFPHLSDGDGHIAGSMQDNE